MSCIIFYIKRHVLTSETATNNFTIGGDTSAVCLLDEQDFILKLKNSLLFRNNRACINLRIMFLKDVCWFLLFNTYRYLKMQFKKFEFSYRKKKKFYPKCISLLKGIQIWYVSIFSISKTINITQQDLTDELTCETNNTKILILTQFKLCLL